MTYREVLSKHSIAISISDSPDMAMLGLSDGHLRDAMAEIARHMLALGARLVYGGDLRQNGFSELLFELVARHRRDADEGEDPTGVISYLAWPVHIQQTAAELEALTHDLSGSTRLILLRLDGRPMSLTERRKLKSRQPDEAEWPEGLTAMRRRTLSDTDARIALGGRIDKFKGDMPGIAEESLLSLRKGQPLFLMGGFGGCARDIAETIGLLPQQSESRRRWPGLDQFRDFSYPFLNNGLSSNENETLARTPHVDQAVLLILRGLLRVSKGN
jgi:hypothetical protein